MSNGLVSGSTRGLGEAPATLLAGAVAIVVLDLAGMAAGLGGLPRAAFALLLYAAMALIVVRSLSRVEGGGFTLPNLLTFARATLACPVAAAALAPPAPALHWAVAGLALGGLVLDGLDGHLARARGEATAFGARFDMEADALLLLALALVAVPKVGWVALPIGLMRYLFVAAGFALARLRRPLPPSASRRAIAAVQGVALTLALLPPVAPSLAAGMLLLAGVLLLASFASDVRALLRTP